MTITHGTKKFLKGTLIFIIAASMVLLYLAPIFSGPVAAPQQQLPTQPTQAPTGFIGPMGSPSVKGPTAPPSLK